MLLIAQFFILLALANGTPLLARKLLRQRFAWPLDGGLRLADGEPLFGKSKTLRGVLLAVLVTTLGAVVLGLPWQAGTLAGAVAMAGDLFSSFIKRRMHLPPSSKATGLDQIPEALFPAIACQPLLGFSATDIAVVVVLFFLTETLLSPVFYRLNLRKHPH